MKCEKRSVSGGLELLAGVDLDARVAGTVIGEHSARARETIRILVEDNIAVILDELALAEAAIHRRPAARSAVELDAGLSKTLAEGISSLPRVIVRDLAVDVVQDMGLGDAVRGRGTDPAHEAAEVAKEVAVQGREGTAGEGELGGAIVRESWVGVLQERDQDEPVVNPDVGGDVVAPSVEEAEVVDRNADGDGPEDDADVRENDLEEVVRRENDRLRVEV